MRVFGIEITADFRSPIVGDEDLKEYNDQFKQAKANGDTEQKCKVGNRLFDQGYVWDGENWQPRTR